MCGKDLAAVFAPLALKNCVLPTRLVRSATEFFCSSADAHIAEFELEAYRRLSAEPLGMLITAHTCVSPEGRSNLYQNAAWSDDYLPDLRDLRAAAGAVPAVLQLGHGGAKAQNHNGGLPVFTPDTMTKADFRAVVRAFGAAAKRAQEAGFMGVMLHGAHGYLLSQMFCPELNHRADEYGGSAENRFRLTRECLEEVKAVCGADYPVFLKINSTDRRKSREYTEDVATALNIAEKCGLEAAEISGFDSAPRGVPSEPYFLNEVRFLRARTELPLIEVGGVRSGKDILACLAAGADAVSLCRPLMREPHFPSRLRDEENAVSLCSGCCACFLPKKENAAERCAMLNLFNKQ